MHSPDQSKDVGGVEQFCCLVESEESEQKQQVKVVVPLGAVVMLFNFVPEHFVKREECKQINDEVAGEVSFCDQFWISDYWGISPIIIIVLGKESHNDINAKRVLLDQLPQHDAI